MLSASEVLAAATLMVTSRPAEYQRSLARAPRGFRSEHGTCLVWRKRRWKGLRLNVHVSRKLFTFLDLSSHVPGSGPVYDLPFTVYDLLWGLLHQGSRHLMPHGSVAVGPQTVRMLLGGLIHPRSSQPEWLLEVAPQLRSLHVLAGRYNQPSTE